MTLRAIDTLLLQQALMTGGVRDGLTGQPTRNLPTVSLFYQTADPAPPRPYPLTARVHPQGHFVFAGDPQRAFPQLSDGTTLALRLTVSAAGYQPHNEDFSLSAAALTLQESTVEISGHSLTIARLNAPLRTFDVALDPLPLSLRGRVIDADELDTPLPGAQVSITAPDARGPVTADANGFFSLHDLPVAQTVTVQVSQTDYDTLTTAVVLNYRQPVHQQDFALIHV
jgi:hypothetical protein